MQHSRKDISLDNSHQWRLAIERYRRFMALRGNYNQLVKAIEKMNLTPGVSWRPVTDNGGTRYTSNKSDVAECYACGKYFGPDALKRLEDELGTRADRNSEDGLW